jgi:hypothetical protein
LLKKINFDIRFIDESHNGGSTDLAQKILEHYGKNSFTVQITATYLKPVNDYNINKEYCILWDLEDIRLCKNIDNIINYNKLIYKHGNDLKTVLDNHTNEYIKNEYSKYPELQILTHELKDDIKEEIIKETKNNDYGWSSESCFLLKQGLKDNKKIFMNEFQNENENLKIWYSIFGKMNKFNIPNEEYPDENVFIKRIEKICKNPLINSRSIDEMNLKNEPMIIMAFIPQNNVNLISEATIKLLTKYKVIPDYVIISINSKTTNDPKKLIEDARINAKNNNKKGVLVLSGKQCSLGVSINNCDIVILLNNTISFDMLFQMMFRCMTEGENKKCGFVIDLNIHRVVETFINYSSLIKPNKHPKKAIKYILHEKIINLNSDHWLNTTSNGVHKINDICEKMYNLYSSNIEKALSNFLNRLSFKKILLTNEDNKIFNTIFNNVNPSKEQIEKIKIMIENPDDPNNSNVNKGIKKDKIEIENPSIVKEPEEKPFNYMDVLKHIIPLICLLTIHDKETSFMEMFNLIKNNEYIYNILLDQTKSWWGNNIDSSILKQFINVYTKYIKDDKETNQIIITIKELFIKNVMNSKELSLLIDKYLIPQELEKKTNAEVSTPHSLRQDMLNLIPLEFWKSKKKVFEPCSGKGGFLIDIIDKFMNGLSDIKDEKQRYKVIIEECLYFSDINATNIFICKLLLDPYNEYKLNYNEGNTLDINIKDKWNLNGFDAVIGNPPYQNINNNKGIGNTLWDYFVKKSLECWLKKDGYLLYVHPRGWRQYNNKIGKLMLSKQIIHLNMNNIKKGLEIFKCSTDYDFYLIKNINSYKNTIINDYKNEIYEYELNNNIEFIPNHSINMVYKLINKCDDNGFINDQSTYESRKKWMSKKETNEYKYPCIYSINSKNEISKIWSCVNDKGHFNVIKFIFSNGNGYIKDIHGLYGLTQWAYAFKCNISEMDDIEKAFKSSNFKNIIDAINLTSNKYNYNVMKLFKKDFWKEFI